MKVDEWQLIENTVETWKPEAADARAQNGLKGSEIGEANES